MKKLTKKEIKDLKYVVKKLEKTTKKINKELEEVKKAKEIFQSFINNGEGYSEKEFVKSKKIMKGITTSVIRMFRESEFKRKEMKRETYLLKHNPKKIATMFCEDCGEVVRMDRLKYHKCKKTRR